MALELSPGKPTEQRVWATKWLQDEHASVINGHRVIHKSGTPFQTVNPATGAIHGTLREATTTDLDEAVKGATAAFRGPWAQVARRERTRILYRLAQLIRDHQSELATLESLDNGKLFQEAIEDIVEAADVFEYYAGWTDKLYGETCPVEGSFLNYTVREPVGVCGLVVPWNFPFLLAIWKVAPALAMGNTVIIKPSPFTPHSLTRFIELVAAQEIVPHGVMNVVHGGAAVGEALCKHPAVHKVSFTGSTSVGRRILTNAAESNLKSVTLELGGKSPNIVFEDVPDLNFAIARSFTAMFSHKGEKCSEPTRFIIHRKHYDTFVDQLAAKANEVRCGDPFAADSQQGPQCNAQHLQKVLHYLDVGKKEGARVAAGGSRDTNGSNAQGYFVRPTVFADVKNSMAIAQEEIFGPVVCCIPFDTEAEAVAIANDTMYGLAAGLWTSDVSRAHRVASQLDAGMVFINRYGCYDFSSPFGGFKQSGWGKEMALHSLDSYTKTKSIWVKI